MTRWHLHSFTRLMFFVVLLIAHGCAGQKPQSASPPEPTGGTTLLPGSFYTSYYSTQKARALGETYDKNLEHLLTQLTQSSIGTLQFSNAIVSLSVGFFTHAASQPPDERYLEALIGMPDILDEEKDFSTLVGQLFSQYGRDVLSTLAQDEVIARDNKIAGYGIHFSWRGLTKTPSGPHLTMREAVLYFAKDQVAQFLNQQLSSDALLSRATLFSRRGEHPAEQVHYLSTVQQRQPSSPPYEEKDKETAPLPTLPEQEQVQTPPVTSPPDLEGTNADPPSRLEPRRPKKWTNARVGKRKQGRKRTIRRSAFSASTGIPPAVTTTPTTPEPPVEQQENQTSPPFLPQ